MSRKTILTLKNIDAAQVLLSHYGFTSETEEIPETILSVDIPIKINDLLKEKSNRCIYFLDNSKNRVKYWVNMIDITQGMALPIRTAKPCWWCRHSFTTRPIGCPIKYSAQKDEGLEKERIEERFKELNYSDDTNDFFETEGFFCSFPCVKSFIQDQKSRSRTSRYRESQTLLTLLYEKLFGEKITIPRAPSWKMTTDYGGHLTPEEFRSTFGRLEYDETVNIRRPYMFASSGYIQETRVRL